MNQVLRFAQDDGRGGDIKGSGAAHICKFSIVCRAAPSPKLSRIVIPSETRDLVTFTHRHPEAKRRTCQMFPRAVIPKRSEGPVCHPFAVIPKRGEGPAKCSRALVPPAAEFNESINQQTLRCAHGASVSFRQRTEYPCSLLP
jgi:hypothetical protein